MDRGTGSGLSFAKRIYLPRSIGLGIGFFCVAAGLWPLYSTTWLWALLVFNGFVWPHLAYQLARRSATPYQAERRNLLIDSVFGGFWAAAMQFNVLPSVTILAMMAMNNIAAGGGRFFAWGCVAMLLGGGLAMLLFGPALAPDTSMPQLYACLPMLILYPLALGIAMLLSFPSLASSFPINHWRRAAMLVLVTLAVGGSGWLLRSWVPPATLWMTEVAISTQLQNRTPGESLEQVSASQIRSAGLYAYTAIKAPRGLNERIYHVWKQDGKEVDRIALNINGGRKEGYRAWTHKQVFPSNPVGHWQVRVLTEDGQVIGVLRFEVVDDGQASVAK